MIKLKLQQTLGETLLMQKFGENIWAYSSFAPTIKGGHIGIDLMFGYTDAVKAFHEGEVVFKSSDTIVILCQGDSNDWYETVYSHCLSSVKVGDIIVEGQTIGYQDYQGPSIMWQTTTPDNDKIAWSHLHFGLRPVLLGNLDYEPRIWDYALFNKKYYYGQNNATDGFIDPTPFFTQVMERVADAIEKTENTNKVWNNPGALRWSPFQTGEVQGMYGKFSTFDSYEQGRKALLWQLNIASDDIESNSLYKPYFTISQFFEKFAPSADHNDTLKYVHDVCWWTGLKYDSPISDWQLNEIKWLEKYNYNPYYAYPETSPMKEIFTKFKYLWNLVFQDNRRG